MVLDLSLSKTVTLKKEFVLYVPQFNFCGPPKSEVSNYSERLRDKGLNGKLFGLNLIYSKYFRQNNYWIKVFVSLTKAVFI